MKKVSLFLAAAAASMALVAGAPHVVLSEDAAFSAPIAATKDCRTCYASCYRDTACIAECVRICAAEKPNGLQVEIATTPIGLTPCQAACKLTADAAKALCKLKRKDRRDHCEWQVAQALDVCNTACDLKIEEPIAEVAAPAKKSQVGFYSCDSCTGDYQQCSNSCSPGDASCLSSCVDMFLGCMGQCDLSVSVQKAAAPVASTPVGDCQPCDAIYDRCLPGCNGMSTCQTKCMENHFDCRMQTPGCFKAQAPVAATPVGIDGKQTMCKMACIAGEAAANTACKKWLPKSQVCLDNVAAARQICDMGCGLLKAVAPVPVPAQDAASCDEACSNVWSKCQSSCQDLACAAICDNSLNWCTQACTNKAPATVAAEKPVEGVACVAACKLASKAAEAACKLQKPSHRARCKENVAKVETDCEAACVLIPTVKAATEVTTEATPKPIKKPHASVGAPAFALAESEYQKHFTSFVQKHGKKYTRDEFFPRYSIFKANLNKIHAHNAKGLSYSMAVNEFADMTFTEFHAKMTGYKRLAGVRRSTKGPHTMLGRGLLAKSVDWRQKNAVTPVKNQQQCGSCWSFSATGSTEGAHAIKTGRLVSLSEQQLVDCSAAQGNQGCNGGMMDAAFQYIIANGGITTEDAYPYTAQQGTCQTNMTVAATLSSFVDVTSGSETALMQAVNIGPVSVAIEADQQCFQFYSGGVLSDPSCGTNLDHGVLVVGYGTDNTVSPPADYWIVKNSWGDSWGEDGYIRLARGSNECGIATEPSYPVV